MSAVVIDRKCDPADPFLQGVRVLAGDFRQAGVLEEAGIRQARGVLILTSEDPINISTTLLARHLNPQVRIGVRIFNQNLIPRLAQALSDLFALGLAGRTTAL